MKRSVKNGTPYEISCMRGGGRNSIDLNIVCDSVLWSGGTEHDGAPRSRPGKRRAGQSQARACSLRKTLKKTYLLYFILKKKSKLVHLTSVYSLTHSLLLLLLICPHNAHLSYLSLSPGSGLFYLCITFLFKYHQTT